jgi:hypothetical protein
LDIEKVQDSRCKVAMVNNVNYARKVILLNYIFVNAAVNNREQHEPYRRR